MNIKHIKNAFGFAFAAIYSSLDVRMWNLLMMLI